MKTLPIPAWLDDATAALVEETVSLLIKRHADLLLAVILCGSLARHEERPPDNACPSDVDLLAILDNLARDGILLYARGSLPSPLASRQSFQGVLEDKGVRR